MTYFVNLVQRGISANTHPVSGRSGKGYGTAVNSPQHGGVVFRMSLQDYMNAAHDICGNPIAGQQWVPEFIQEAGAQAQTRPKCDRCPKPSVAIWDRYPFCADHAPANATWYDENERAAAGVTAQSGPNAPDVLPKVVEAPMTPGVVDKKAETQLPREQFAPSFVGSAEETSGAATGPAAPKIMPEVPATTGPSGPLEIPPAGFVAGSTGPSGAPPPEGPSGPITETGPTGVSGAAQAPPAVASPRVEPVAQPQHQEQKPDAVSVVAAITEGVIKAVVPQLEKIVEQKIAAAASPPAPPAQQPRARSSAPKKKPAAPKTKEPTEFQKLQTEAKGLGINLFGKGKEQLVKEIAEKKGAGANAQPE
jgi:hypothetical protein